MENETVTKLEIVETGSSFDVYSVVTYPLTTDPWRKGKKFRNFVKSCKTKDEAWNFVLDNEEFDPIEDGLSRQDKLDQEAGRPTRWD